MDNKDQVELIEKARQGDRQSLERLAEEARVRLRGYVLRLTMDDDLAGDIVQESILEMFKIFGKLKRTESFWPWLYGIAFNKVRSHYGYGDTKQYHCRMRIVISRPKTVMTDWQNWSRPSGNR